MKYAILRGRYALRTHLDSTQPALATIEVILIIIVLIALAILFKDVIIDFVKNLLGGIEDQSNTFNPDALTG